VVGDRACGDRWGGKSCAWVHRPTEGVKVAKRDRWQRQPWTAAFAAMRAETPGHRAAVFFLDRLADRRGTSRPWMDESPDTKLARERRLPVQERRFAVRARTAAPQPTENG